MSTPASTEFLGLRFHQLTLRDAAAAILQLADGPTFSYVVTPNVDHIVQLHKNGDDAEGLRVAYEGSSLCLCDSQILALLAKLSGIKLEVVAGSDLTAELVRKDMPAGTRVALIGGDEGQREWLERRWPTAEILQHQAPKGLRKNEGARLQAAMFVESSDPDIVLLTVGAPQSEMIASLIQRRGRARGVSLCVGASLEFLTGAKRRAPRMLQRCRLEWAFRLITEPRRLWRRYLAEGPLIFLLWLRWRHAKADS